MATLPPPSGNSDFTPCPEGTHRAICYRVIDLGTQRSEYLGQVKTQRKVLISWEIPDETFDSDDGPKPYTMHQRYTWSMHEKATLRHHLESWRGKRFADSDFGPGGFDIQNIIGVPCLLSVVHNENNGKTYANIGGVMKLPKDTPAPVASNPPVYLWLDGGEFNRAVYDELPQNIQETISVSPEFQTAVNGTRNQPQGGNDLDDSIPF